ncbi:MAG: Ig-like domain-containing protein [Lachnospiraceae bacterium]|nr:Ig-like domain-containing protein [Lachnospiraceae bacterium]
MKNYFISQYGAIKDIDFTPIFEEIIAAEREVVSVNKTVSDEVLIVGEAELQDEVVEDTVGLVSTNSTWETAQEINPNEDFTPEGSQSSDCFFYKVNIPKKGAVRLTAVYTPGRICTAYTIQDSDKNSLYENYFANGGDFVGNKQISSYIYCNDNEILYITIKPKFGGIVSGVAYRLEYDNSGVWASRRNKDRSSADNIELKIPVNGFIDQQYNPYDLFKIDIAEDSKYFIEFNVDNIEYGPYRYFPYVIKNENNEKIDSCDIGAGNTTRKVNLKAGTYYIEANSYVGSHSPYKLTISKSSSSSSSTSKKAPVFYCKGMKTDSNDNCTLEMLDGKKANFYVKNAKAKDVTWSSNDESIATIKKGIVNPVKTGRATITAKLTDGTEFTCLVIVEKPYINESRISITKDIEATYKSVSLNGLLEGSETPVWISSRTKVATVDSNGKITPVSAGKTIISTLRNKKRYNIQVTIYAPEMYCKGMKTNSNNNCTLEMLDGKKANFMVKYAKAKDVTWSSSDESIATIKKGIVTPVKTGRATITAKLTDGTEFTCLVIVEKPYINESRISITKDIEATYKSVSLNGLLEGSETLVWVSSKTKVATVDSNGKITPVSAGKTIISTLRNKKRYNIQVTIYAPEIVHSKTNELIVGETKTLKLKGASTQLKVTSSDPSVIYIQNNTRTKLKGLKEGTSTITIENEGQTLTYDMVVVSKKK